MKTTMFHEEYYASGLCFQRFKRTVAVFHVSSISNRSASALLRLKCTQFGFQPRRSDFGDLTLVKKVRSYREAMELFQKIVPTHARTLKSQMVANAGGRSVFGNSGR